MTPSSCVHSPFVHVQSCKVVVNCCFRLTKAASHRSETVKPLGSWVGFVSRSHVISVFFILPSSGWESGEGNSDGGPAGEPQRAQQEAPQQHQQAHPMNLGWRPKGDLACRPVVGDNSVSVSGRWTDGQPFNGLSGRHRCRNLVEPESPSKTKYLSLNRF